MEVSEKSYFNNLSIGQFCKGRWTTPATSEVVSLIYICNLQKS